MQPFYTQAECMQHILAERQLTDLTPADLFEEMDLDCDDRVALQNLNPHHPRRFAL